MTDPTDLNVGDWDERRRSPRQALTIPAGIQSNGDKEGVGVTRNLSHTGALLATPLRLRIGARTSVRFVTRRGREEVEAKVVRFEHNPGDSTGLWPYNIAVKFFQPLADAAVESLALS